MKTSHSLIAIMVLGLGASGCSDSKSNGGKINSEPGQLPGPAWTIRLTSQCNGKPATECVAAYGFSVRADGKFQGGPAPESAPLTGNLSEDEFKAVTDALAEAHDGLTPGEQAENCGTGTQSESTDSLELIMQSSTEQLLKASGTTLCYHLKDVNTAAKLYGTVRALAKKYYLTPYPDACNDAVQVLESLYSPLRGCDSASDCTYVDAASLDAIPPGNLQYVLTEDCTRTQPLVVANADALVQAQGQLLLARTQAKKACGANYKKLGCKPDGFQSIDVAPACVNHVCQRG